jgi:hypothetical protein
MSTNQRVQILRLLAVGWLSIVATGCLKGKMSEQNAVRTEGADARYLETVPVQTESGQPGLCLYSAKGSPSAAGSIDPSNTEGAEVISGHALYQGELIQGELIQGLETIPGIDAIREAVINDLVTPAAIIGSAALAAAGRFSNFGIAGNKTSANAPIPASTVNVPNAAAVKPNSAQLLVSGEARDAFWRATRFSSHIDTQESRSFTAAKEALMATKFSFAESGAKAATDEFLTGPKDSRYEKWINTMLSYTNDGPNDQLKAKRLEILMEAKVDMESQKSLRSSIGTIMSKLSTNPTKETVAETYKLLPRAWQPYSPLLNKKVTGAAREATTEARTVKSALRGIRLQVPSGFKNLCKNANGSSWAKAGLCTAGVVAGVFGIGNLAAGFLGGSSADTDSIRSAIAADAASSPDVVIDGNSYAKLIEGLRQFSDRIAADPTIQSMRPTCQ